MSKKKAPALHERRGREDISTQPPRLAGSPIKLAGKTRLRRLSLAADSCVNRKYYGGDPGVGQRARGFVHKPCIRSGPRGRVEIFARSSPGSHEEHIKCSSARAELATNITKPHRATYQPDSFQPRPLCTARRRSSNSNKLTIDSYSRGPLAFSLIQVPHEPEST